MSADVLSLSGAAPVCTRNAAASRLGALGALGMLIGILTSGPASVAWVEATHPQPSWQGPDVFVSHYHRAQVLPYVGGILLVLSVVLLLASLHALAPEPLRARANLGLVCAGVFASFIFLNYTLQTSYLPMLARGYAPGDAALVTALSMSNPESLAWALEMWGWGFSGLATWSFAPVFAGSSLERATSAVFSLNGCVSIAGTFWTTLQPGWMMTGAGLVAFALWNLLFASLALLAGVALRRRSRQG